MRHIARRAMGAAILAVGILVVLLGLSRQAHAASLPTSALTSATTSATSAVTPAATAATSAVTPAATAAT